MLSADAEAYRVQKSADALAYSTEKQAEAEARRIKIIAESLSNPEGMMDAAGGGVVVVFLCILIFCVCFGSFVLLVFMLRSHAGETAVKLLLSQQYINQFGKLAKETTTLIIPQNLADISSIVAAGAQALKKTIDPNHE
jgi:hypothetical protein